MIRLKSFGNLDLRGVHGELRGILTQPKRLALLLRLAAERPGAFLRRDTLLAMFWPELDTAGARNALRQALFHLRRELGEGVLLNRGDEEVGLDPAQFGSDISEFEEAAATGRWRVALDLVRGELAPGLHVSEAVGFEEWLEGRRADIRRRAAEGAWALCREAEAAGAPALAASWARRAMEHTPDDEAGLRKLLALLIQAGDAAGAAEAYGTFEGRMRREYGVAPAPETVALRRAIPTTATDAPSTYAPPSSPPPPVLAEAAPLQAPAASRRTHRDRALWWAVAGLGVLAAVAVAGRWRVHPVASEGVSRDRVLIAPFRTTTSDSVLAALSVGLVDLTAARLSGASVPHPVDPDMALRAVAEARAGDSTAGEGQLRAAARSTGAGLILGGTLVREGTRILLVPVLTETESGKTTLMPQLSGPIDSLPWMVDRMAASLLSTLASEDGTDAPALATIPLPALRAYLDGREAMRDGRVAAAMAALARALELDSTFALAARDYAEAADWLGEDPSALAKRRAWALRDRLGTRDRAILVALTGRRFPALTPIREQVADWEAAIRWAPDRAQTWFGLGDVLFHVGALAGIADAPVLARNAFDRALALDSASVPALLHRVEVAAREGDTAVVRRLRPRAERAEAPSDAIEFIRWRSAVSLQDSTALRQLAPTFDSMSTFALMRIVGWGQLDGLGMADPVRALAVLRRRASTAAEAERLLSVSVKLAGNRGRLDEMEAMLRAYGAPRSPIGVLFYAGEDALRSSDVAREGAGPAANGGSGMAWSDLVVWQLWRGDPASPTDGRRYLATLDQHPGDLGAQAFACLTAVRLGLPDAQARLMRADSLADLVAGGDQVGSSFYALARCHEAAGDRPGALAMLARRPLDAVYGPGYLAGMLYDEGRLALQEGDGPRVLRAWRHLLALRDDPDPALRPQVAAVRRVVDSLSRR